MMRMTSDEFGLYFSTHHYTQKEILENIPFYRSNEFIKLIKTFEGYAVTIAALYKKYGNRSGIVKFFHVVTSDYYPGFDKRIMQLKRELDDNKIVNNAKQKENPEPVVEAVQLMPTQQIMNALKKSGSYEGCMQECSIIASNILRNYQIDEHVKNCIDNIFKHLPEHNKEQNFVFNVALTDHVLSDVTNRSQPVDDNLLKYALEQFVTQLNPVTQVTQWIDLIATTAHFVADVTLGQFYLSPAAYGARIDGFYNSLSAFSWNTIAQMSAKQWVHVGATIAADCVFAGGVTRMVKYLKELEAFNNLKNEALVV
jgi:hypothetical protein